METIILHPNDRILFQGDSITNAFRMPEEISSAYQLGAGYGLLIASHLQATRPADNLEFLNRGVSGNGLLDLADRWEQDCLSLAPTVVSILVGVNETIRAFASPEENKGVVQVKDTFQARYHALLRRTKVALPEARLIICEPFVVPFGAVTPAWRDDIAGYARIAWQIASEFDAVFVPLQREFDAALEEAPPEYWAYDGIHPSAAGHGLIARAWLRAVDAGTPISAAHAKYNHAKYNIHERDNQYAG